MPKRTKENAMHTRQQILVAAELEFAERGMAHTTLANIAQRASVTRGAIYWHFQSKEGLFQEMLNNLRLPLEFYETRLREKDPLSCLERLIVLSFQTVELDPAIRRRHEIIFYKSEATDQALGVRQRRQHHAAACHHDIESALKNAVTSGQLPDDLDVSLAAASVQAWVNGHVSLWLLLPGQHSIAASARKLARAMLDMLQTSSALRVNL